MDRKSSLSSSSSSSSEEEEQEEEQDRQTLIHQVEKSPNRPSVFHTDTNNNNNNNNPTRFSNISKHHLFLIFLSLFLLILLLSTDLRSLFSTDTNPDSPIPDPESQALSLLRQQQLRLFELLRNNNKTSDETTTEELISLNNRIRKAVLSAHRFQDNVTDPIYEVCGKKPVRKTGRPEVGWNPTSGKYLLAICVSGQMSNHLVCLEKHMLFAALLGRVLVIPSDKVDYRFDRVLDIDHINECLGRSVVVSFEEFAEARKGRLRIDRFVCYFSHPKACFLDDDHVKKLGSLGMTMGKLETAWVEDVKNPSKKTMRQVVARFSAKEDVIAIGDVFFADVEEGAIASKCKALVEPSRLIMLTAQRFVQTFLGERFTALHFRRHGFLKFCNAKSPSCFFPIPQAAECISRLVEKANTPVIYLSTDAAESETNLLQSLIVFNGKTVPLVKRPARNSAEKWDALLYRHGIEGDLQVEAMLDKTISAMSSVFIGAPGSTFTEDILRLRKDWGSASLCDQYLCQGELPNFIADNE